MKKITVLLLFIFLIIIPNTVQAYSLLEDCHNHTNGSCLFETMTGKYLPLRYNTVCGSLSGQEDAYKRTLASSFLAAYYRTNDQERYDRFLERQRSLSLLVQLDDTNLSTSARNDLVTPLEEAVAEAYYTSISAFAEKEVLDDISRNRSLLRFDQWGQQHHLELRPQTIQLQRIKKNEDATLYNFFLTLNCVPAQVLDEYEQESSKENMDTQKANETTRNNAINERASDVPEESLQARGSQKQNSVFWISGQITVANGYVSHFVEVNTNLASDQNVSD